MKFLFFIIIFSLSVFTACSKTGGSAADNPDQVDQNDDILPVLTINKPVNNQQYASGDSIVVQGYASDNKVMYKGTVKITNDVTGLDVKKESFETHAASKIDFYVAYKAVSSTATNYTIVIEFQDHGLNLVAQTLKVKVNP